MLPEVLLGSFRKLKWKNKKNSRGIQHRSLAFGEGDGGGG